MFKIWKIVEPSKYNNIRQCLKDLKKKKINVSYWIEDIIRNKKNKLPITKKRVFLYRIKVSSLGFKKPTTLKKIYKKIKQNNYLLVSPDIALRARFLYKDQKKENG